ncbi:MAG TPA: tRNA preQ1(34) S-adenosylmethionine ribosyltransferase-isomerase QueA [Chloroflexota bacterium]|nr:tRNA preQ1(34) S-adenosylmethionine ribosyltransferase-isomerase QueA [Chloroflexota bacterium]
MADLRTDDFDYHLPPERIAQTPVEPRDASRMLVIDRASGTLEHRIFREIGEYLRPGDLLVANDSRVLPGRLWARRATGGKVELLLLRALDGGWWEALARPMQRLHPGQRLRLSSEFPVPSSELADSTRNPELGTRDSSRSEVELGERTATGAIRVRFDADLSDVVQRFGHIPLPPYIREPLADPERYQTVYARVTGSAAAPTAGLHFTPALLDRLSAKGIQLAFVTLHVGPDTFRPVRAASVTEHKMHAEFAAVPEATARAILAARREGRRVVAVGTTSVRALESWASAGVTSQGWSDWTRLFIYPGYRFQVIDALITNFHLPRSTLLMLVSAFAGHTLMRRAYEEAVATGYRFYSFGDCCLIL